MQDRAEERRQRLIDAGYQLIGTEGAAATTVRAVCREAELSRNYFYENFSGREELLIAVADRLVAQMRAFVEAAPPADNLEERLVGVFDAAATYLEQDPRRVRIIFREFVADETLREHTNQTVPVFFAVIAAHFGHALDGLVVEADHPEQFAIAALQIYGAVSATYLGWLEGRVVATRATIARECTQLVLAVVEVRRRKQAADTR